MLLTILYLLIVPRSFKLLEELEQSEKSTAVPPPHAGYISYGLVDPSDMTLSTWNASIIAPTTGTIADRLYTLVIVCPEDYPNSAPSVRFVNKINMPSMVDAKGAVSFKGWTRDCSMSTVLCALRKEMASAGKLPQPGEGETY